FRYALRLRSKMRAYSGSMPLLTRSTWFHRFELTFRFASCARLLAALGVAALLASCGTTNPPGEGKYRVQKGDTLTQIARKHGQSVNSLRRLNKLIDVDHIRVGQVLKVKGAPAVAASSPPAPVKGPSIAAPRSIDLV